MKRVFIAVLQSARCDRYRPPRAVLFHPVEASCPVLLVHDHVGGLQSGTLRPHEDVDVVGVAVAPLEIGTGKVPAVCQLAQTFPMHGHQRQPERGLLVRVVHRVDTALPGGFGPHVGYDDVGVAALRGSDSRIRVADTTPDANVSAAISHMAAFSPKTSAVSPASSAPIA